MNFKEFFSIISQNKLLKKKNSSVFELLNKIKDSYDNENYELTNNLIEGILTNQFYMNLISIEEVEDLYFKKGVSLNKLKYNKESIIIFNKLIEINNNDSLYYYMRSFPKENLGDIIGSIDDLEYSLKIVDFDSKNEKYKSILRSDENLKGFKDFKEIIKLRLWCLKILNSR